MPYHIFQIHGIQNSFEDSEGSVASSGSTVQPKKREERKSKTMNCKSEDVCSEENGVIPLESSFDEVISEAKSDCQNGDLAYRNLRSHPELKLELKKLYEFSPPSEIWNESR